MKITARTFFTIWLKHRVKNETWPKLGAFHGSELKWQRPFQELTCHSETELQITKKIWLVYLSYESCEVDYVGQNC